MLEAETYLRTLPKFFHTFILRSWQNVSFRLDTLSEWQLKNVFIENELEALH